MVLLNVGPMGPRGLGPNPFSIVSPCPPGFFFGKKRGPDNNNAYLLNNAAFLHVVAILANVDLNMRL